MNFEEFIKKNYPALYNRYEVINNELDVDSLLTKISLGDFCDIHKSEVIREYKLLTLKGRVVKFTHIVQGAYYPPNLGWELYKGSTAQCDRAIYRTKWNDEGICLGWTRLHIGSYDPGGPEYGEFGTLSYHEPASFWSKEQIKVFVVEPHLNTNDNRYYKPLYVLPEDIDA